MAEDSPGGRIGRNVRAAREAQLLSRADLAERSGVSVPGIDHLERGLTARPRRRTVEKLAKAMDVPVEHLMGDELVSPKVSAPPSQPNFNNELLAEEKRRAGYLGVALEEIRGKAEAARWALKDVPSFTEAEGDITPAQKLESWGHFIGDLRDDVHHKARRWRDVFSELSGHEMPGWEWALVDELRHQLERYEEIARKLRLKFNDQWQSFQQSRGEHLELVPKIHQIRHRQGPEEDALPAPDDDRPGSRPIEEAGEAS